MSQFVAETAVEKQTAGRYAATVAPHWNIGDNPNGGYLLTIVLTAMADVVEHPDPVSVTTHFLRPGIGGAPADIDISLIRGGRSFSTVRGTLKQAGKERLIVVAAFADLSGSMGVSEQLTIPAPAIPSPEDCVQRSGETQGLVLPIAQRLDTRLHPDYAKAGLADRAQVTGWIRLADGTEPTTLSVPMFADAFPPSVFALLGRVGWVPTVELTVHVRARPTPGWIQAAMTTDDLSGGRMLEDGKLWDSSGRLVVQSRQLGLVRAAD